MSAFDYQTYDQWGDPTDGGHGEAFAPTEPVKYVHIESREQLLTADFASVNPEVLLGIDLPALDPDIDNLVRGVARSHQRAVVVRVVSQLGEQPGSAG
jgi:hypothetical protein